MTPTSCENESICTINSYILMIVLCYQPIKIKNSKDLFRLASRRYLIVQS